MSTTSTSNQSQPQGQQVDLTTLSAQQLLQIKKQLDDELEHLNASFSQLRAAQTRFAECVRSIEMGLTAKKEGDEVLVPLTTSLYVPGRLMDRGKVVVDVGTGFFVEKTTADANKFYEGKITDLGKNLKSLEGILVNKGNNLRVIEDVLRQKMAQQQQSAAVAKA